MTLTATIMLATAGAVNGEGVTFTETISAAQAKKGKSLKDLIVALTSHGTDGRLAASAGPFIGLADEAPIKYFSLKPNDPVWKARYCDVVLMKTDPELPAHPDCFVMIDKRIDGNEVRYTHYRFDLTGRLLAAHEMLGKYDGTGKPVRGSARDTRLDITDKKVREDAERLLDFWLSGQYKKHLAPPPSKPAEGRK